MAARKYYCDYCDKQFQDTPSARKRHLRGIPHQMAKKLWFDSFNNPSQGVCRYFSETGFCKYGNNCKYVHPVQIIQQCVRAFPGENCSSMHTSTSAVSSMQSVNVLQSGAPVTKDQLTNQVSLSLINLPPSLRPPHGGGYQPLPFIDWG